MRTEDKALTQFIDERAREELAPVLGPAAASGAGT
jgi:ubiquinone biosynthesis protein UbiJ